MPDAGRELDHLEMKALLTVLAERARGHGIADDIYVVGGAAIAMTLDDRRLSRDIDAAARTPATVSTLSRIAADMATEFGLKSDWFNFSATAFVPPRNTTAEVRIVDGVVCAPPEHLLAMKLVSQRSRDMADIDLLAATLDINSLDDLTGTFWSVYDRDEAQLAFGADPDNELRYAWQDMQSRRATATHPDPKPATGTGDIWIPDHERNGRPVRGHWRRRR